MSITRKDGVEKTVDRMLAEQEARRPAMSSLSRIGLGWTPLSVKSTMISRELSRSSRSHSSALRSANCFSDALSDRCERYHMQVPGIRGKGWGMRELQESMEEAFSKAPRILLAQFVTDALAAACLSTTDGLVERLVDHVMSGSTDRFQWDDGDPASGARTLTLDFEDFENKIDRFLSMIPEIIENVSEKISKGLLKTLRKN